ncbi:MAG: glycosyltransferase family 2 protein [Acidobacteria bacterium]|nr:glycosyltransferase family 2 protein [Acidobacteriota bacterium]MCG3195234.1 putative glycosyltransferase [Thermoanaerobaculia bacterium]
MERKRITVAMPVFNEEEVLPELIRRLKAVAESSSRYEFHFLFVDDGSRDRSFEILSELAAADPSVTVIRFSRNFGHQAALEAGLDHARGDAVVLMDADLQDPPEVIPEFLRHFEEGNDVVYAIRVKRKEGLALRIAYALYYRVFARLSSLDVPLDAGDFSLLSARVARTISSLPEQHRYLRGLRSWAGFRQKGIPIERSARYAGERKYTYAKLLALAADGLFSFSVIPLRAAALLGFLAILAASAYGLYAIGFRLLTSTVPVGFSGLLVTMVFLSGVQLFFFGVVGEYIGRIYEQGKGRPPYVIDRIIKND